MRLCIFTSRHIGPLFGHPPLGCELCSYVANRASDHGSKRNTIVEILDSLQPPSEQLLDPRLLDREDRADSGVDDLSNTLVAFSFLSFAEQFVALANGACMCDLCSNSSCRGLESFCLGLFEQRGAPDLDDLVICVRFEFRGHRIPTSRDGDLIVVVGHRRGRIARWDIDGGASACVGVKVPRGLNLFANALQFGKLEDVRVVLDVRLQLAGLGETPKLAACRSDMCSRSCPAFHVGCTHDSTTCATGRRLARCRRQGRRFQVRTGHASSCVGGRSRRRRHPQTVAVLGQGRTLDHEFCPPCMVLPVATPSLDAAAFRRRIRELIEALLACDAVRAVRLDLGTDVLAGIGGAEQRQHRLSLLKTSELVAITFDFALTTRTAATVNKRLVEQWRRQGRTGVSPHYRLLSEIAHVFASTPVNRSRSATVEALFDFYLLRRPETGMAVPTLDVFNMHDPRDEISDHEWRGVTLTVPSPPADMIASAFRWARMTVEHAGPELGGSETKKELATLDRLVRRLLRRTVAARPSGQVRDVLSEIRHVLRRAGHPPPSIDELKAEEVLDLRPIFSEPDLDALTAEFSSAIGLKALSPAAVKKDQQRLGQRRARTYRRNIGTTTDKKPGGWSRSKRP